MSGGLNRRSLLGGLAASLIPLPLQATPAEVARAITTLFGSGALQEGPLHLDLPLLAETGNSVPLTLRFDSPMTADDRIVRLALFAELNPRPLVCELRLSPLAATARLGTNLRLSSTQTVVAVAEHASGQLFAARREVRVVIGACTTLPGRY